MHSKTRNYTISLDIDNRAFNIAHPSTVTILSSWIDGTASPVWATSIGKALSLLKAGQDLIPTLVAFQQFEDYSNSINTASFRLCSKTSDFGIFSLKY